MQTSKNSLFVNDVRARLLTRAGLHLAISQLKYGVGGARDNFCDSRLEDWYYKSGATVELEDADDANTSFSSLTALREVGLGSNLTGYITCKILDSASQINLNDNNPNLGTLLSNLSGLNSTLANNILSYRNSLPNNEFSYKEQLLHVSGITDVMYQNIKDFVTIHSWSDEKASTRDSSTPYDTNTYTTTFSGAANSRSPINVNTAPKKVLEAVLTPITNAATASSVADSIITRVATNNNPFYSWRDFDLFIDDIFGSGNSTGNKIKNSANPNRVNKPSGFTTEFCFHSGGYYEIEVLTRIKRLNGSLVARRKAKALVKIFDLLQHTTKDDFRDEDTNNDGDYGDNGYGEVGDLDGNGKVDNTNYLKVTWLDSCPVNESDDQEDMSGYNGSDPNNISPFLYRTIPNAVKLGFWDNFDEGATNPGQEQSRAWWGTEYNDGFEVSDCKSFNYDYGDWGDGFKCDSENVGIFVGPFGGAVDWGPEQGQVTPERVHTYDEAMGAGDNAFFLDDNNNELWKVKQDGSLSQIPTTEDFSTYFLGGQGGGLGWDGSSGPGAVSSLYKSWNSDNGFYVRAFNYDGPRSSIGIEQNFPGYNADLSDPEVDESGRDRQDVGKIQFFGNDFELFLYPIGNVYQTSPPYAAVTWGTVYEIKGPRFFARADTASGDRTYLEDAAIRYQRDKVYKSVCVGGRVYYYVYTNAGTCEHPDNFNLTKNYTGFISLYSNNNQSAWDEVRAIDDEGFFAKHFIIPNDAEELGSFNCNINIPSGSSAFLLGTKAGGNPTGIGIETVDISSIGQESNFVSGAYSHDIDIVNELGAGVRVLEGPTVGSDRIFSYSIRLATAIGSLTKNEALQLQVPALEDVSVTYLIPTEIVYYYEQ